MKAGKRVVRNWRPRFFVHLDKKTLRLLALLLFSACWTYTALLTLPFRHGTPATNLDSSYGFGSNYFPDAGFRYGSDLIFTYGPLGYLFYPEDIGNHIVIANMVRGAIWALLLVHLVLLYRVGMNGFAKALLFMVAIIPISIPLLYHFDYYAVSVLIVLIVYLIERPRAVLALVSIVFLTGILALTKFTGYAIALVCVLLLLVVRNDWERKLVHHRDVYLVLAVVLALPVAFLLHNPSLVGLFNYVYGSLQLSSGYSDAMSTPTGTADIVYETILVALFALGLIYATAKRALPIRVAAVLLVLCWMNFKHGFVRGIDHTPFAFLFQILLAALLIALLRPGARLTVKYAVVFPFFVTVALLGLNLHWLSVWNKLWWSTAIPRQATAELLNWEATRRRIEDENNKSDEFVRLPAAFRNRLEKATAIVFPWELSYARSGHFKLQPLYVMQAYSAYTAYLDRKTAEHIRADSNHAQYVLFDWQAIDTRHPLLDVPATWMALADSYEPVEVAPGKLLLRRRDNPVQHKQGVVQEVPLPIGQWVSVPHTTDFWARIRIPYTPFGAIRKAAFKADAVYLTLESRDLTVRFRVVPAVLSVPFPLTRFPVDVESFVDALQSKPVEYPITRIRLDLESPNHYGQPSLELLEETLSQITFAESTESTFRSEFHVVSPAAITKMSVGNIDVIHDGHNVVTLSDEQHPLQIDRELLLEGWLADRSDGRAFDDVYAVIDGKIFRGTHMPRPDVGAYYKNPALDLSGFRIQIDAQKVKKGIQKIDLIGVMTPDQTVYRLNLPVWVYFQ